MKGPKGLTDEFYGFIKSRKHSIFVIDSYLNDSAVFAVLQDSLFNSQCVSILPFKLISIHASKSARLFHFYISRINSVIFRTIR